MTSPRLPSYCLLALALCACSSADAGLDATGGISAAQTGTSSDSGPQATTTAATTDVSTTADLPTTGGGSVSATTDFLDFGSSVSASASDTDGSEDTGDATTGGGTGPMTSPGIDAAFNVDSKWDAGECNTVTVTNTTDVSDFVNAYFEGCVSR